MSKEFYTISEVANLLNITTQAVYKRLQQDGNVLDAFIDTVNNKKSISKPGVIKLTELMNIANPFATVVETQENTNVLEAPTSTDNNLTLLSYLQDDNERLRNEIKSLKEELGQARALREQDRQVALEERRTYEESRKRTDTLLMKAISEQNKKNKPKLLERWFGKHSKDLDDND